MTIASKKIKCLAPRKNKIRLIKAWMNVFAETKANEEKEIYEYIWTETLLWIFTCSYSTIIAFIYILPYYSQQI